VYGGRLVRAVYSRLSAKHVLRSWVQLLALAASEAGTTNVATVRSAVTIGRGNAGASTTVLRAPAPEHALAVLAELVGVRDEALREPLPLLTKTSHAYARRRWERGSVQEALSVARKELGTAEQAEGGRGGFESIDAYHVLAWGEDFDLTDLLGEPNAVDRATRPQEPTRFGALASRVWSELLAAETFEEAL
jgi:exodeoxyribonuclease V gamma subunit